MKSIGIKFISLLFGILAMFASVNMAYSSKLQVPLIYSPPLGYTSSSSYGPYPLTIFGSQNPNLLNIDTCFLDDASVPIKWPILFHAGTDWFELNGNSAAGDSVTAIADGVVEWVSGSTANYPGAVVIIRHADPDLGTLYSVYMHLINPVKVQIGDIVNQGTQLGEVIAQTYISDDGTPVDNSHLHWEVRTFADATQQAWFPQSCDGSVAGEGYTKDDPTQYGYIDPDSIFNSNVFLPLISKPPTPTITPTPTETATLLPTATPTATPTPTPIPCVAGVNLVQNGDFEDPSRWSLWVSDTPNLITPYENAPNDYTLVMGYENSQDQTVYQTVTIPPGVRSVAIKFLLYIRTWELAPLDYDYLYVDLVGNNDVAGASLLHDPFVPFTNQFPQGQWTQQTLLVDDVATLNTPLRLQFHATTNWALATAFYLDNVQLITGCQ